MWRRTSTKATNKKKADRFFRFFGGKGGVGKTTLAAARAVQWSEALRSEALLSEALLSGRTKKSSVLLLSTDPAHSLHDAIGSAPPGIEVVELDARDALERWLTPKRSAIRIAAERGTYFDRDDVDAMLDLSFPGIDELIGLVEITRAAKSSAAPQVIVDTAPTGHTLHLFAMPDTIARIGEIFDAMSAKHRYMKESIAGAYRSDATDQAIETIAAEGAELAGLVRDPERCRFTWVLLPEVLSVEESFDGIEALEKLGVTVDEVVINRLTPPPPEPCAHCEARRSAEAAAIKKLGPIFAGRAVLRVEAREVEPRGVRALAELR